MIVGSGRDKIMHEYVSQKECKKFEMVLELTTNTNFLTKIRKRIEKYLVNQEKLNILKSKHTKLSDSLSKCIRLL